jgi:uncharacterized membrane protein YphA (DoxX/SURF4 family)
MKWSRPGFRSRWVLRYAVTRIPLAGQDQFDSYLAIINLIVLSIAVALLGPGAFSLDARMFGRREITIPTKNHLPRT